MMKLLRGHCCDCADFPIINLARETNDHQMVSILIKRTVILMEIMDLTMKVKRKLRRMRTVKEVKKIVMIRKMIRSWSQVR